MRDAQDVDVLAEEAASNIPKPLRIAIPAAAAVVVADQVTKSWAFDALEAGPCSQPGNCIDLFAGIKFHLIFNTGAAFTQGSGFGPILAVLAFFMSGFLFYLASRRSDRLGIALFGVVAGGAIGNLLDRIFRAEDGLFSGAVVDFIDVGWWPVFNVADIAIVVGVVSIIVLTFFEGAADSDESETPTGGGDDEVGNEGRSRNEDSEDETAVSVAASEDVSTVDENDTEIDRAE